MESVHLFYFTSASYSLTAARTVSHHWAPSGTGERESKCPQRPWGAWRRRTPQGVSPSSSILLPKPDALNVLSWTETLPCGFGEQSAVRPWMPYTEGALLSCIYGRSEFFLNNSKLYSLTPDSPAEWVEMSFSGPQQYRSQRPGISY